MREDERRRCFVSVLRRLSRRQGWPRENDEKMREEEWWEKRNDERRGMTSGWKRSEVFCFKSFYRDGSRRPRECNVSQPRWSQDNDERMSHDFTESEARMRSEVCTRMYRCMLYDVWWPDQRYNDRWSISDCGRSASAEERKERFVSSWLKFFFKRKMLKCQEEELERRARKKSLDTKRVWVTVLCWYGEEIKRNRWTDGDG